MGTFGCVRSPTMCVHASSLCESCSWNRNTFTSYRPPRVMIHFKWYCRFAQHSAFVCYRYENGQVGDVHIDTEEDKIHRDILQVIASMPCWENKCFIIRVQTSYLFSFTLTEIGFAFFDCQLLFKWKTLTQSKEKNTTKVKSSLSFINCNNMRWNGCVVSGTCKDLFALHLMLSYLTHPNSLV